MVNDAVRKWRTFAATNLREARILFMSKAYQGSILACHQALEKYLKAVAIKKDQRVKKTHDLPDLLNATGLKVPSALIEFLEEINAYYNPTRYPDAAPDLELAFNRQTAARFLKITKTTTAWLKNQANL